MLTGCVYISPRYACSFTARAEKGTYIYISAWASALLVQTAMGNAKASECGTGDRYRFPAFFIYANRYCFLRYAGIYLFKRLAMNISSKFSLYDILAMIIPGWMIIQIIKESFPLYSLSICSKWELPFSLILSYLIGLVWHTIMEWVFSFLRNETSMIKHTWEHNENEEARKQLKYIMNISLKLLLNIRKKKNPKDSIIQDLYYQQYYFVLKHTYSNDIRIIEGQVVFLKNSILVLIAWGIRSIFSSSIGHGIITVLFAIAIYITMIARQNKIYELVWSDYKYLRQLVQQQNG